MMEIFGKYEKGDTISVSALFSTVIQTPNPKPALHLASKHMAVPNSTILPERRGFR